jgi:pilus assembly protein CpaB
LFNIKFWPINWEAIMRRGRIFFYLAFILILILVGGFVVWQRFLQPAPAEPAAEAPEPTPIVTMVDVVVVAQSVPRGATLTEDVLEVVEFPQDAAYAELFREVEAVVGRQAKFDLEPGVPVTAGMLVTRAEELSATGSLAALGIPRGKVAVSIPIVDNLSSVSYAPRPGDNVSVIVSIPFVDIDSEFQSILPNQISSVTGPSVDPEAGTNTITIQVTGAGGLQGRTELDPVLNELTYVVPAEKQRPRMVSQVVLPNAEVLQLGNFPLPEEEEAAQAEAAAEGEEQAQQEGQQQQVEGEQQQQPPPSPPEVITLIVTPQEAVTLNYLISTGTKLTLALRAAGDDSITPTEATTLQYLLDVYSIPVPAKLPYATEPRPEVSDSPFTTETEDTGTQQ